MRVAVLGGSGYLGAAVVRALRARNVIVQTVRGREASRSVMDTFRPDAVVHAAASPLTAPVTWDEEEARLRELAARGVRTLVIGSAAVLAGSTPDSGGRFSEAAVPRPLSDYGSFKYAQERESLRLRGAGWPVTVVRLFNPIGAGMKPSLMLGRLLQEIVLRERSPDLTGTIELGDLSAYRDYCHVDDAADALASITALTSAPDLIHVGSGTATLSRDLAHMALASSRRADLRIMETPAALPGPLSVVCDPSLVRDLTGWSPARDLMAAIRDGLSAARNGAAV